MSREKQKRRKQPRDSLGIDSDGTSEDSGSEQKRRTEDGEEVKKSFRLSTRRVFLTYSACPMSGQQILDYLQDKLEGRIGDCFAKQEKHRDGSLHCHLFLRFAKKFESTNQHVFDVQSQPEGSDAAAQFHPNIKRCQKGVAGLQGAYEYLCKDGIPPAILLGNIDLYPTSKGFTNKYRDRNDWLNYRRAIAQRRPDYPLRGPEGEGIPNPGQQPINKRRHYWVYGPPDCGKSTWLRNEVFKYQCYRVGSNDCPFDNYQDQQLIVYDDVKPKAEHLLSICEYEEVSRPVPGRTRYLQRYVPGGLATLVIVCSNFTIRQMFEDIPEQTKKALEARFIEKRFVRIDLALMEDD